MAVIFISTKLGHFWSDFHHFCMDGIHSKSSLHSKWWLEDHLAGSRPKSSVMQYSINKWQMANDETSVKPTWWICWQYHQCKTCCFNIALQLCFNNLVRSINRLCYKSIKRSNLSKATETFIFILYPNPSRDLIIHIGNTSGANFKTIALILASLGTCIGCTVVTCLVRESYHWHQSHQ